jgi:hypothetical protein
LSDDDPEEKRLALVDVLPEDFVVVAFEVAESQPHSFFVDFHEGVEVVLRSVGVSVEVELALVDVHLILEEGSHVAHVLEEGALHETDLAVETRNLCNFIDEVEYARRDVDHLDAHDLKQLSQQLARLLDKVYHDQFVAAIVVELSQKEDLHRFVVVLAQQLQESESAAETQLVV